MRIMCKLGPRQVQVVGETYDFAIDAKGRAVAEVHRQRHIDVLLAVEHYEEVRDEEAEPGEEPAGPPHNPLDHDNDGHPGGSLPKSRRRRK